MTQKLLNNIETRVLDVIAGRVPIEELTSLGIEILACEGGLELHSSLSGCIVPAVTDIAAGFEHYTNQPLQLQRWAFFLVAETAIDLSKLSDTASGASLLNRLWDAAAVANTAQKADERTEPNLRNHL